MQLLSLETFLTTSEGPVYLVLIIKEISKVLVTPGLGNYISDIAHRLKSMSNSTTVQQSFSFMACDPLKESSVYPAYFEPLVTSCIASWELFNQRHGLKVVKPQNHMSVWNKSHKHAHSCQKFWKWLKSSHSIFLPDVTILQSLNPDVGNQCRNREPGLHESRGSWGFVIKGTLSVKYLSKALCSRHASARNRTPTKTEDCTFVRLYTVSNARFNFTRSIFSWLTVM